MTTWTQPQSGNEWIAIYAESHLKCSKVAPNHHFPYHMATCNDIGRSWFEASARTDRKADARDRSSEKLTHLASFVTGIFLFPVRIPKPASLTFDISSLGLFDATLTWFNERRRSEKNLLLYLRFLLCNKFDDLMMWQGNALNPPLRTEVVVLVVNSHNRPPPRFFPLTLEVVCNPCGCGWWWVGDKVDKRRISWWALWGRMISHWSPSKKMVNCEPVNLSKATAYKYGRSIFGEIKPTCKLLPDK